MKKQSLKSAFGMVAGATLLMTALPAAAMESVEEVTIMMDSNGDAMISRDEYVSYKCHKAAMSFHKHAKGAAVMRAEDVYKNFASLEAETGG